MRHTAPTRALGRAQLINKSRNSFARLAINAGHSGFINQCRCVGINYKFADFMPHFIQQSGGRIYLKRGPHHDKHIGLPAETYGMSLAGTGSPNQTTWGRS